MLNFPTRRSPQAIESRQATPQTQEAAAESTGLPFSGRSAEDHQESRQSPPQAFCRGGIEQLIQVDDDDGVTARALVRISNSQKHFQLSNPVC